jgi:CHASE2 domain-containing sensor protein
MIVMREPVPDRVAQEFLHYFLKAFANGDSLYLAQRQAREKLQGLEDKFPCASWLPVICQNPVEVPPDWLMLRGQVDAELTPKRCSFLRVFLASIVVTSLLMGVRSLGLLQAWELQAFDQLMRLRPAEKQDQRLLVVEATEEEINKHGFPLPDATLAQVIEKLETHQPRVIGLDIFRDRPREPGHTALASHLQHNSRLIALCSVREPYNPNKPGIAPPPMLPNNRLGFSDLVVDPDGILRRQLLFMQPNPTDPCATDHSFSVRVALHYLAAEGIEPQTFPKDRMQLGKAVFTPLEANTGAYQQLDDRGFQVLLNYRDEENFAQRLTIAEVLSGKVNPNWVKDRIVLIGVTAPISADDFSTPYSAGKWPYQKMPGVLVHAQMVSQILSAVLDKRPLLWTWSWWGEVCWVWGWSMLGGLIVWRIHRRIYLVLAASAAIAVLYGVCFGLLIEGGWVPLVPSALALVATCGSAIALRAYQNRQ